jgi:hypothetical protein
MKPVPVFTLRVGIPLSQATMTMPRSTTDPDYEYRPMSDERKAELSVIQRRRLGIPDGFHQVYGHYVPDELAPAIRYRAQEVIRRAGKMAMSATMARAEKLGWETMLGLPAEQGPRISSVYSSIDTTLPVVFRG